jgi:hypothetical protein
MQKTFTEAITAAKSSLVREGVPSSVYNAYTDAMCTSAHHPHPDITYEPSERTMEIIERQEALGQASILKGFHHEGWAYWLQEEWKPRPKNDNDGKKKYQKDPLEQSVSLIRCSWDIFEKLWEERNSILHDEENILSEAIHNRIDSRLLEFRRERDTLLRKTDHSLINLPAITILGWSAKMKKLRLRNLERLHRVYLTELKGR